MEFVHNYTTADQQFKVLLPIEFSLIFHRQSEIARHRAQIVKHRLKVYDVRFAKSGYRTLYVNDTNTRVFFMSRVNRHAPNSAIYYLDELIKVK